MNEETIIHLLSSSGSQQQNLWQKALEIKKESVGSGIRLRGLIELSNVCSKNCYYCGIRADNKHIVRYHLSDDEVLDAARKAASWHFGSIALQSGEQSNPAFTQQVERLIRRIKQEIQQPLGITLSCGEQSQETYQKWYAAGAHRYLLRIETSSSDYYRKLHPIDHLFSTRIQALKDLKNTGFMTGSGVMVGLPNQPIKQLAKDLLFLKEMDVDMAGIGPFIPHSQTPLGGIDDEFWTPEKRFQTTLNMLACARILMSDINLVATTAMQTLHPQGREMAVLAGANVIMPNVSPDTSLKHYKIYPDKPQQNEATAEEIIFLEQRLSRIHHHIIYDEWGDAPHYSRQQNCL